MKQKTTWVLLIVVILLGVASYAYREYNRKVKDLAAVEPQVMIRANDLIAAFEKNESTANVQYLGKIIAVSGKVKTVEKDDKGYYSVILGDQASMSSVRCSMDSAHQQETGGLTNGMMVTIKGACTGFNADELLGSDVILNRCVFNK